MAARIPMNGEKLRRIGVGACLAMALAGCQGGSNWERIGQLFRMQIQSIGGPAEVQRDQVVAIPYATLGVQLGSSDQAMFVLQGKSGNDLQWVGGTQFAIATRGGRILRTAGFKFNLTGLQSTDHAGGAESRDYRYDFADMNDYGIVVRCTLHDSGAERIVILGDAHETHHLIEDCTAAEIDWSFTNEYWVNPTSGFVWKSVQNVHPGLDSIILVTLRPAA
jgi:hypothetical protein